MSNKVEAGLWGTRMFKVFEFSLIFQGYIMSNKVEAGHWGTRMFTVF